MAAYFLTRSTANVKLMLEQSVPEGLYSREMTHNAGVVIDAGYKIK